MNLIRLMRPHQWVKNSFVFTGLIFGHAWHQFAQIEAVLLAFAAFCMASSSVYVLNDLFDREQDKLHPTKCLRPIASGAVSVSQAWYLSTGLALSAVVLAWLAQPAVTLYVLAYLLLNVAYTLRLKQIVILDIFCISGGFMLRILAGTAGLGIPPSNWLLFCGLWATLFLGFIKRRAEIQVMSGNEAEHRKVLGDYSSELLNTLIGITCTGMILSYSLYTMDTNVWRTHGTDKLIFTVPFVIYACFRYLFILHRETGGGDPSRDLLGDRHIVIAGMAWLLVTLAMII